MHIVVVQSDVHISSVPGFLPLLFFPFSIYSSFNNGVAYAMTYAFYMRAFDIQHILESHEWR